jgi:hypothetical protein
MLLGLLSLVYTLVRTAAWVGILTALFGWRPDPPGMPPLPQSRFQFSILSLLILTTVVAVLCVVLRTIIAWLGDSALVLVQFVDEIPLVTCWVLGIRVALVRWPKHPGVSLAAVIGIGLSLAAFLASILHMLVIVSQSGPPRVPFIALAVRLAFSSVAVASWIATLTAVFSGRNPPAEWPAPRPIIN